MGDRYCSYKTKPKVFKLVQNFPLNGPHKRAKRSEIWDSWVVVQHM